MYTHFYLLCHSTSGEGGGGVIQNVFLVFFDNLHLQIIATVTPGTKQKHPVPRRKVSPKNRAFPNTVS